MTTAAPPTTPKPRRRWLQFSLRTMMVLVLVFGAGFGWLAREVQRARRQVRAQREAVKAIRELGGSVVGEPSGGVTRTVVAWLGKLVGEDLSGDMTEVFLIGNQVSDAGLAHLRGLTQLKGLNLSSTQVTDAGLEHLRGLTRLTYLHLSNTQVTDASVNELKKVLPNLYVGR